jgi:hypothetical protein
MSPDALTGETVALNTARLELEMKDNETRIFSLK